jgi:hypothetical protein
MQAGRLVPLVLALLFVACVALVGTVRAAESPDADGADFVAVDLGALGRNSFSIAVNARGQVVGDSATADEMRHATLWEVSR